MGNAHMHMRSPQQHLLAPVLRAVDDLRIGFLFRDRVLPKIRKRVPAGSPDADIVLLRSGLHGANASVELSNCFGNGVANSGDRKSTRLNSSHVAISYAVFCLKKKKH